MKSLFGGKADTSLNSGEGNKSQQQWGNPSHLKTTDDQQETNPTFGGGGFTQNQRPKTASGPGAQTSQQQNQFGATTLSGQGSVDSGIEVIDTGFSRKRTAMKRPPTTSGAQ